MSSLPVVPLVTGLGIANLIPHCISYLICLVGWWKSVRAVGSNSVTTTFWFIRLWNNLVSVAMSKSMPKILAIIGCSLYHLSFILRFLAFEAIENRLDHTMIEEMQSFGGYFWILQRNLTEFIALGSISLFFLQFYYDIYMSMTKWSSTSVKKGSPLKNSFTATERNLQGFRLKTTRILLSLLIVIAIAIEIIMCLLSPEDFPCVLIIQLFKIVTEAATLLASLVMLAILISSLITYTYMTSDSKKESNSKPKLALQKLVGIYLVMVFVLVLALLDPILHGIGSPYPYYPTTMDWNYKITPLGYVYGFVGMFAVTPLIIEGKDPKLGNSSHLGSVVQKSKFVSSLLSNESHAIAVSSI